MAASVGAAFRDATRVDRRELTVSVALRAAVGMAIVLVAGVASGHTLDGVTASIGALSGGIASRQGTYRTRAAAVVAASAGMAVSAVVGGLLGHVEGPDVVLSACWGLAAGLLVAFGPVATVVGLQSVVGLEVFSQFHFGVVTAVEQGLWVLAGGLVQTLLVVVVWPLRRFPAERRALGEVFDQLAGAARAAAGGGGLPPPGVFADLAPALADPQPFGGDARLGFYRALADQAERSRLELAALSRAERLALDADAHRAGAAHRAAAAVAEVVLAAADAFEEVAVALREARPPRPGPLRALDAAVGRLTEPARSSGPSSPRGPVPPDGPPRPGGTPGLGDGVVERCRALAGQVRAAARLAAAPAGASGILEHRDAAAPGSPPRQRATVGTWSTVLRANLSLSSPALRHGIRLAVTLAVAVVVSHAVPLAHRYWLPMTAVIVLKPDFRTTVVRGLSRVAGTLFGAGLVTLAVAELRPGDVALTAGVVVLYVGAVALLTANYAAYSACIASLVVLLLAFVGEPAAPLAAERALYTTIGAAVALVAYVAWPTWEATTLPVRLADLVETERAYLSAVLGAWVDPGTVDVPRLHRLRLDARLARVNTEAAAQRFADEPTRPTAPGAGQVDGVLAAVRSLVHGVLALHAWLPSGPGDRDDGAAGARSLARLAAALDQALGSVAAVLGGVDCTDVLPPLRRLHTDLAAVLAEAEGGPEVAVLLDATDQLVNDADTLGHLVGLRRPVDARPRQDPA